jgi:hypothetical protein
MNLPNFINFQKRYGLLITDNDVTLVSWQKGDIKRLALFSNDESGIARFHAFIEKEGKVFNGKAFHLLVNIIGEDYRFEKTAHLIGKYKTDFHSRRMQHLFRGSKLSMSQVQGREERGRREDWVLFSGILTENKVSPWMAAVSRGGRFLAGVHMVSHLTGSLLKTMGGVGKGNNLVMTIHERGLLRQTYYSNGHLRFSRVSKVNDESADSISTFIKKEVDRTLQYLNSLKMSIAGGITVRVISPSNMVGQLREIVSGGEKIKFDFHDVATVAQNIGLKNPVGDLGKDSSLALHAMFSELHIEQLAKINYVTYYRAQFAAKVIIAVFAVYGIYAYSFPLSYLKKGYIDHSRAVISLQSQEARLRQNYQAEVSGVGGEPLSSPTNMRAVSNLYKALDNINISPTQMMYFFSQGLAKNNDVRIEKFDWYLSNNVRGEKKSSSLAVFSGEDLYQIIEVSGTFLPLPNENYIDVADRAEKSILILVAHDMNHI